MENSNIIPVEKIIENPYNSILYFPKSEHKEIVKRIEELMKQKVTHIEFKGKVNAYGLSLPILGKGFSGIVVIAHLNGKKRALKILRADANKSDLLHEALMLTKANAVNVGPKIFKGTKNFLFMQFIEGELLPYWLEKNQHITAVKRVLKKIFDQCWRLDCLKLDHGELSNATKHIIIDKKQKPWILDFESASDKRKASNLTSICHFLFFSKGSVSRIISKTLGEKTNQDITESLRTYKQLPTHENYRLFLKKVLKKDDL